MNRREFVKFTAAGSALLAAGVSGAAEEKQAERPGIRAMRNPVRVASIQAKTNPRIKGLCTDPFDKNFTIEQLHRSVDGWLDWHEELFAQAAREKCRLVVVTEDFTRLSGTMMYLDDRSIFRRAVERQTPVVTERVSAAAKRHGMYLVACFFAAEGDKIHNVADLFGPSGDRVGRYRKVHMPQYEKWQVTPGNEFPAFETELGWIGMLICYDQMWPEAAGCCAMNGAQLICHPSAAILKDFTMLQRAMDNQVHYLSATKANSRISAPWGEMLGDGGDKDPAIVWADVDLKEGTRADEYFYESLYSGIRDHKERHLKFRRPETYKVLTAQEPPLARQYPEGGVADTPEAIRRVYETVKRERQGGPEVRGRYHWKWH